MGDFALADLYGAAEAFVTGTFGGITSVSSIDGRRMPAVPGLVTTDVRHLYKQRVEGEVERLGLVSAVD